MVPGIDTIDILIYIAVGIVSPFLVDIVVKQLASTKFKTLTLLAINLLTGLAVSFGAAYDAGQVFDWKAGLTAVAFSFIGGAASVFGFKNINVIGADSALATAGGIGSNDPAKVVAAALPAPLVEAPVAPVGAVGDPAVVQAPVAAPAASDPLGTLLAALLARIESDRKAQV